MGGYVKLLCLAVLITVAETWDDGSEMGVPHHTDRQKRASGSRMTVYSGSKMNPIICPQEGFIGDASDCSIFYRCVKTFNGKYTVHKFKCGPGTIYDPDAEVCNHAKNTKRTECGGTQIGSDKDKKDEKEVSRESPIPTTTNSPFIFHVTNNKTAREKHPTNTTDLLSKKDKLQIKDSHSFVQFTQPDIFTYKPLIPTRNLFDKGENTVQAADGNGCTENGFMGNLNDCRKFHRCVSNGRGRFIKYEFTCSEGTVWDSKLEACNYAWAVKDCADKSNTQPIGQTTNLDSAYKNQYSEHDKRIITSKPTPIKGNNLVNDCSSIGVFGDINDCKIFFRCIDNGNGKFIKLAYKCENGTVWDPSTKTCNNMHNATSCHLNNKTKLQINDKLNDLPLTQSSTEKNLLSNMVEKVNNQNNSLIKDSYKPTHIYTYTSTKTPINKSNVCQTSGFIGDVHDCKTFYRCVDDGNGKFTQHTFSCGEGTVWDQSLEACNHEWAVPKCKSSTTSKNTMLNSTIPPYTEKDGVFTQSSNKTTNKIHSTHKDVVTLQTTTRKTIETTHSTNKNQCAKSGFRPDAYDCTKFYRCVDNGKGGYTQYEYSCGGDTVWDSKIEACNHRWAVKKCNSAKEDNNLNITPIVTDNIIQSSSFVNIFQTTKKYHTTTSIVNSYSESPILLQSPDTGNCKSEGFFADMNDCNKFYRCVKNGQDGYTKYDFVCGEGTTWNQNLQTCDHKSKSNCSSLNMKPDMSNIKETTHVVVQQQTSVATPVKETTHIVVQQQTSEATPVKETTHVLVQQQTSEATPVKVTTNSNEQKTYCKSEGYYANPNDCSKFYRCVSDGKAGFNKYEFTCGEGTIWIQENQVCDHDTGINICSNTSTSTAITSSNINSKSTYITTTSVPKTTTQVHEDLHSNKKCKAEGYYPHEHSCKKFYRCVYEGNDKFTRYDYTCAEGTAWNTDTNICDYTFKVNRCEAEYVLNQNVHILQDEQEYSETNTYTEATKQPMSTKQPNKYESTTAKPSTAPTTDKTKSTKKSQDSTTKSSKPTKVDECKDEGYFGSSSNCKKFYRCVSNNNGNYTKYDFTCGEGTIWDQNIVGCNHPENVVNASCKSSDSNEMSTESSSSTSGSTNNQQSSSSSTSSTSASSQSSTEPSKGSDDKPTNTTYTCTEAGFFADPNDCKKFYRCVDWDNNGERFSVFHFVCGQGTLWDQSLLTCNHEDSVNSGNCSSSQQQSQSTTEETSTETETSTHTTTTKSSTTQTSTSQKPTTEKTTTQKSTTQESTTHETTAQESTTQKSTTQASTTQETTTQESTTQASTTQKSTTQESTTQETTAQESTTQKSTTQESTTQESTTQTSTTQESTTQSSSSEQTTSETTEQSSSTTETDNQTDSTTETSSTNKDCPQTNEGEYLYVCPSSFRKHPKYCNIFYQCTEDDETYTYKIATFKCPNNTIFDESKVQCVAEKSAESKCEGEIERRRVKRLGENYRGPITVGKEKMGCQKAGYHLFEKKEECSSVFIKCESGTNNKLQEYVYKCPEGYLFWKISRRCEAIRNIKDCKRSSFDWSRRNEIPIEKLNVAP